MRDADGELRDLDAKGLRRHLRRIDSPQGAAVRLADGADCLNFSSNDYLGLSNNEELKALYCENIGRYGVGSGASRLICGTMSPHLELEEKLAEIKRTESALTFSSGYAAATGTLPALCGSGDVIILDKLCHASLIDGAKLSGASLRIYPHQALDRLESHLNWASQRVAPNGRIVVVTESVFSMDGDIAPIDRICDLKERYGALLLVDEAHAFGVLGPGGRGLGAEMGQEDRIDLQMGTFSKAAGISGGYVCCSRPVSDLLVNRARSFIYSTAPSPALAATIRGALDLVCGSRGDELRRNLSANREMLSPGMKSAIHPVIIGENDATLSVSAQLLARGFLVPAIRYPTVPKGSARLRITLSASHNPAQINSLKSALAEVI